MPVERGRVVLGIEGEETSMAGSVALFRAVENLDGVSQCPDNVIAQPRNITVPAGCRVEEKN